MAVVMSYQYKNVTIQFDDEAYRDASPEEIARRTREIQRTAWRIWEAAALRAKERGEPFPPEEIRKKYEEEDRRRGL